MKKEDFVKLGLDEETAKKCETASQEELKGYIPKGRFDEVNNAKNTAEALVKERDGQLETLKNSAGDVEALKKQIGDLQKANKDAADAHAAEIKKLQREAVDNELLTAAKAKNNKAVLALLDAIEDTVDIDGYRTKRNEQLEAIQKSDSYLFDAKDSKKQFKGAAPGESGNEEGDKGVDTSKMSYSELAAYLAENPDVKID